MSGPEGAASGAARTGRAPRVELALIGIAVVGGVALRAWSPSPLWLDEALSVHIARLPLAEIPEALRHDGHPPLYYALLHGWMAMVGEGDAAVRGLSGAFGLLLLPVAWALGREISGPRAARLALALAAASPFAVRYSTETRMYSLVMLLVAVGALLVRRGLRSPSVPVLGALATITAALLLTHYWAMWLGAAVALVLLAVARRDPERRRAAVRLLAALAAGAAAFLAWVPSLLVQAAHTGTPWAPPTRPSVIVAVTLTDLGGGFVRDAEIVGVALALLALLGLFARPVDRVRLELDLRTVPPMRGEAAVVGLTLGIGATIGYLGSSTYAGRYAAVVVPLILVLAAVGLSRIEHDGARAALLATVVLGGLAVAAVNAADDRTQAAAHASAIEAQLAPGDVVVACPDQLGPSLIRALGDDVEVLAYPTLQDATLVDWTDYAERNAATSPAAVATAIEARADDDAAIFVTWGGDYRTLEGQCQALVSALQARRPQRSDLVAADGAVFEHATLTRLGPVAR